MDPRHGALGGKAFKCADPEGGLEPGHMSRETPSSALLRVEEVRKNFGGVIALAGVSFDVRERQVVCLIGPNGAGKTTTLNVVNGLTAPDDGRVYLREERVDGMRPYAVARRGVGRTFQVPRIFRRLTVMENVMTPVIFRGRIGRSIRDRAEELLRFVGLEAKAGSYASELSGGQQKLLEFARALMPNPDLILMDEPFAGVHPDIKAKLVQLIKELNRSEGKAFLVVSHDMPVVSEMAERVVVMNNGSKLAEGQPDEVLGAPQVIQAYLGG